MHDLKKRTAVLITDGAERSALALTRSLGAAGYDVFVCSSRAQPLAGASRYCRAIASVPIALADPHEYVTALAGLVARWNIQVLIPVSEASLHAVLANRERFPRVAIPFASHQEFAAICDKARVTAVARSLGIAVPEQHHVESREQAQRLTREQVHFPLVVKPARSVSSDGTRTVKTGVVHCRDWPDLRRALDDLPDAAYPVLLQERIVGPGTGVFLLMREGRVRAAFAHRRLREKPPSGGVSVLCESIPLDAQLLAKSTALLKAFDWQGVAMVEYKLDASTGTPYLMEVNGRFWGSLQLAVDAGVDFPRLLVDAALGVPNPVVTKYRCGVRSRWFWGDVDQLIARIRRSARQLALPPGAPGRLRAVADFVLSFRPGDRSEVLRWRDARPFLRESIDWILARS